MNLLVVFLIIKNGIYQIILGRTAVLVKYYAFLNKMLNKIPSSAKC